ncbi:hypothetical protein [Saccharopolyspora spinosa]|uniref:Uncharacterized protein n=1 Tax=Saccharopolyspora spinosa TaxID=60894 RepID=A0A2N3XUA7_SACSN|nr:hypothetical protein [Saccharopolyspora spinosa]PKW14267.1 hypothetical protein A8926_1872 [Saccharopolyspora spinosa]
MYADHRAPDEPDDQSPSGDDAAASIIPLPRTPPDGHIENLPQTIGDQSAWRYDQKRTRGHDRHFPGHITRVGGPEGEQRRAELADVIRPAALGPNPATRQGPLRR